jgi:hypothetical protein
LACTFQFKLSPVWNVHDRKAAEADLSAGALLDLVMPELGLPRRFLALRKL